MSRKNDFFQFVFYSKPHLKDKYRHEADKKQLRQFHYAGAYKISNVFPEMSLHVFPAFVDEQKRQQMIFESILRDYNQKPKPHVRRDLRPRNLFWEIFYDHCTLEELADNMNGEYRILRASAEEVENTSDDEFVKLVFRKPDTLLSTTLAARFINILKSLRYSPDKKTREGLRGTFKGALQRGKGGPNAIPKEIRTDDALDLMEKLIEHLRGKCTDYLAMGGLTAGDFDETVYGDMMQYFRNVTCDPRISSLSYNSVRHLLHSPAAFLNGVSHFHLHILTPKKTLKTCVNPAEK